MMNYKDWEVLNESVGAGFALGVATKNSLGLMGQKLEWPVYMDDEDDDDDSEEKDYDDDDGDGDFGGDDDGDDLEGDIMGADKEDGIMGSEEGPNGSFPPEDGDDMQDDGMGDVLGDIDPELAGLGGDEEGGMELGPELTGGDLGDEMGGEEGLDGGDMGDMGGEELGDELGGELGGELGDEMGMGMDEPCPECNPEGEMEEGDPDCELCAGDGFVPSEDGEGLDVDMEDEMGMDDMGMGGGDGVDVEGEGLAVADLMHRMQDYMQRYMAPKMAAHMGDNMADNMSASAPQDMKGGVPSMQKKFMTKIAPDNSQAGKYRALSKSGAVRRPKHPIKVKSRSFMGKGCSPCRENVTGTTAETYKDFLATLSNSAKGDVRQKWSSGVNEDALFQVVNPNDTFQSEPQPGQAGFAPQGRVGSIGGGYTQDDFADIPVLGESKKHRYPTLSEYIAMKQDS